MSRYRGYRSPQQNKSISSLLPTTRHAHPPHPHASNYRNYQPIHPTSSTSCETNGQYYSRSFINTSNRRNNLSANKHQHVRGSHYIHYSHPTRCPRIRRCYNSSLCIYPLGKLISARQHIMTHQTHMYHIVNPSPWPPTGALSALLITSGLIIWFHFNSIILLILGLLTNTLTIYQWWQVVIQESTIQGHHTPTVQKGLRYGIILFIVSEVLFFTHFFWAFYHSSLAPIPELGGCWPPTGIRPLNPLEVLLLNTSVLLATGVSITWAHHSLMEGNCKHRLQALFITITLGVYILHSYKPQSITKPHLRYQMGSMDQLSLWPQDSTDYV